MEKAFEELGIHIPSILLPEQNVDLNKWCVVACDQYTSQPDYWGKVEELVGEDPSTLHLVFPEVYLEDGDGEKRIEKIAENMRNYLHDGTLVPLKPGFILVVRDTSRGHRRPGLMVALDLDMYSYEEQSQTIIRATEGTVIERIPPRLKIREKARVELPHIMVLIDDPKKTVIEPLLDDIDEGDKVYDTQLMMDGGTVKGYAVNDETSLKKIYGALKKLADPEAFRDKYNVGPEKGLLLYAMGDGNHSLATAKAHWEALKVTLNEKERAHHPARYTLVELVNVYGDDLEFEPVHRVLFNVDPADVLNSMVSYYAKQQCSASYNIFADSKSASAIGVIGEDDMHVIPFVFQGQFGILSVKHPGHNIEAGTLQGFLDQYIKNDDCVKIDYVHGREVAEELAEKSGNISFIMPPMDKHDLFKTVILEGALPRKTFSMGEADEKRFYLECREIAKD